MKVAQRSIKKTVALPHPPCSQCGGPMRLLTIEPEKLNHDRREFACMHCEHAEADVVKFR
jgi:hypothetical protein